MEAAHVRRRRISGSPPARPGRRPGAEAELWQTHERALLRAARYHLATAALGPAVSAQDVFNSVFKSLFADLAAGKFVFDTPAQVAALLNKMARDRVVSLRRKEETLKRGGGRHVERPDDEGAFIDPGPSPSELLITHELLEEAQRLLSPEEFRLLTLSYQGLSWAEVAARLGGSPEALRQRACRALARVRRQLGTQESGHE
jgi:RNA polymerase sigma factor (sigma-70 family)